jgi:5-methylcytosine-specific restriction protein A
MAFWWVYQGQTFDRAFTGGYLWAPRKTRAGKTGYYYWSNVGRCAVGDIIFCHVKKEVVAIAKPKGAPYISPAPDARDNLSWEGDGWRLNVEFEKLEPPLSYRDAYFAIAALIPPGESPFASNGRPNQGYMFRLPDAAGMVLAELTSAYSSGVQRSTLNPAWSRDELILGLRVYVRTDGNPPRNSLEIAQLCDLLNKVHGGPPVGGFTTLRNRNGIYMKVMNFRRFDQKYLALGKTGLSRGNRLEREVWDDFHDSPECLHETANAIEDVFTNGAAEVLADDAGLFSPYLAEAMEGATLSARHLRRERSKVLVKCKKASVALANGGKLACEECGFDFGHRYGTHGSGFIECHHTRPLFTLVGPAKTTLEDLVLICANCHRMIHARRHWLTMEELKAVIRADASLS